jgi:hypothetical protein
MQSASFTIADLASFTGPGGINLLPQVTGITPVTPGPTCTDFDVTFTSQTALGAYALVIEPTVLDAAGNPVDQNGDGLSNSADRFTAAFTLAPPGAVGPDAFGYDSVAAASQALELVGQSGTVALTNFTPNTDDGTVALNLGTNAFNFYGTSYTGNNQLYVSTNGLLSFGAGYSQYQNDGLDGVDTTLPVIAVLWDDWNIGSGSPQVLYKFFDDNADGTNDRLVIALRRDLPGDPAGQHRRHAGRHHLQLPGPAHR